MVLVIVPVLLITPMLLVLSRWRSWTRLLVRLHLRRTRLLAMFRCDSLRPFMDLWRRCCALLLLRRDMWLLAVLLRWRLGPLVPLRPGFHARLRLGPLR